METPGEGFADGIMGLDFLPDGSLISSGDSGLRIWGVADGKSRVLAPSFKNSSLAVFGSGRYVASLRGSVKDGAHLQITDLHSETTRALPSHGERRSGPIAVDPSERVIVSQGWEEWMSVGPITGEAPHWIPLADAQGVAVSPDGKWIAIGDAFGGGLRLWPMPEVSETPIQKLPYDELLTRLETLTNVRVVRDEDAPAGWKVQIGPFPGWEKVPAW
jgi:WD40 repeat protein